MTNNRYYPKKLIYLGDNTENRKAILVSSASPCEVRLYTIELGTCAFTDEYRQVANASGAEFVDIDDIKIIGQDDQPTVNKNNRGENDEKQ